MILQGAAARMLEKAAWLIYKEGIEKVLRQRDNVIIGFPGGRSVAVIFRELTKFSIDWDRVHIFMLDERLVPIGHRESNFRQVRDELGGHVGEGSLHPFSFVAGSPEKGLREYEKELNQLGGKFDIVLASSGEDGHIGSLFPGQTTIDEDRMGFFVVDNSPKPPSGRMTAGRSLIAAAEVGFLLFIGSGKQTAFNDFLNPAVALSACPAKIIMEIPKHFILTDLEMNIP